MKHVFLLVAIFILSCNGKPDEKKASDPKDQKNPSPLVVSVPESNTISGVGEFKDPFADQLKAGESLLRLKPEPGRSFVLTHSFESTIIKNGMMGNMKLQNSRSVEYQFKHLPTSDGNVAFAVNFIRLKNYLAGLPDQTLIFKSDSLPSGNPPMEMYFFLKMRKRFFNVLLDPMGNCLGVAGLDSVMHSAEVNMMKGLKPGTQAPNPMLVNKYGDGPTKNLINGIFSYLPDQPVQPGSKWEGAFMSYSPLKFRITGTWTVVKMLPQGQVEIAFSGKPENNPEMQEYYGTAGALELKGEVSGKLRVNSLTGFIDSGDMLEKIKGDFVMDGKKYPLDLQCKSDFAGRFAEFTHPDSVKAKL